MKLSVILEKYDDLVIKHDIFGANRVGVNLLDFCIFCIFLV